MSDARIPRPGAPNEPEDVEEAVLTFHEQADGRKVARLPGGKVVLVDFGQLARVADGDRWRVRLRHRDTYAVADLVDLAREPLLPNPVLPPGFRLPPPSAGATPVQPRPPDARAAVTAKPSTPVVAPGDARPAGAEQPQVALRPAPTPAAVIRPGDRVALFVDGANMDGACRSAGYFVDYRKAREFCAASGTFYAGFYYIADFTASDPLQQRYLDFLSHAGYIVRRRPVKVIRDNDTGEQIIKGNLDTEIVLDMLNTVDNYDVAFLFSGDSDFERAIDLLRSRGKRIYLVTARAALSRELSYVADKPIYFIEDHRLTLKRDDRVLPAERGVDDTEASPAGTRNARLR